MEFSVGRFKELLENVPVDDTAKLKWIKEIEKFWEVADRLDRDKENKED